MSARGLRGFAVGVLSLTALEVLVSTPHAAGSVSSAATGISGLVQRALDPTVAAIPNPAGYDPKSGTSLLDRIQQNMTWAANASATTSAPVSTAPTVPAPPPAQLLTIPA